jgi:hypothetical protein
MDLAREDFNHPEKSCQRLIPIPDRIIPVSITKVDNWAASNRASNIAFTGIKHYELCGQCGWTTFDQVHSNYASRVRYLESKDNSGIWALGSNYLLKDIPNDGYSLGNDYVTQNFLSC